MPSPSQVSELEAELVWGRWPARGTGIDASYRAQDLRALVASGAVRAMAPDESRLLLAPPPFRLVSEDSKTNPAFWHEFGPWTRSHPSTR